MNVTKNLHISAENVEKNVEKTWWIIRKILSVFFHIFRIFHILAFSIKKCGIQKVWLREASRSASVSKHCHTQPTLHRTTWTYASWTRRPSVISLLGVRKIAGPVKKKEPLQQWVIWYGRLLWYIGVNVWESADPVCWWLRNGKDLHQPRPSLTSSAGWLLFRIFW